MNRLILLLTLTLCYLIAQSQVVLGPNDWPAVDSSVTVYEVISDTTFDITDSVTLGAAGASGVYDFTRIEGMGGDPYTFNYVAASTLPMGAIHTTANLGYFDEYFEYPDSGIVTDTIGEFYIFGKTSASDYQEVGITIIVDTAALLSDTVTGVLDTFTAVYSIADTLVRSAYSLGYTSIDSTGWFVNLGVFIHSEAVIRDVEVDGEGVLTSARGSFDVLRVKVMAIEIFLDTVPFVFMELTIDTLYYFEYWAEGVGYPIVIAETDSTYTQVYNIESVYADGPVGIKEAAAEQLIYISPNPVQQQLEVRFKDYQHKNIAMINAIGQEVMSVDMSSSTMLLNINDLRDGMYFVVIRDRTGNIAVHKVLIAK